MSKPFYVDIEVSGFDNLIQQYGLEKGGPVHRKLVRLVQKYSDEYVPMDSGTLKNTSHLVDEGQAIEYIQPYSKVHWFGKLMVDPITGKGAFHDPVSGRFWSRKDVSKKLTNIDMKYRGAPERGPHWAERMWVDHGEEILAELEKRIQEGKQK